MAGFRSIRPDRAPARATRWRRGAGAVLAVALAGAAVWGGIVGTTSNPPPTTATFDEPFTATHSPWKIPVPANPELDPNSDAIVNTLLTASPPTSSNGPGLFNYTNDYYGIPIWRANSGTPRYAMSCLPWAPGGTMPIPAGAVPNLGGDHKLAVIDMSARLIYDLWEYNNDHATCQFGGITPLDSDGAGFYDPATGHAAGAVAIHTSSAAGVIRVADLRTGAIHHALSFLTSFSTNSFRWPAAATDGTYDGSRGPGLPEGARIQLDPGVNVDAIAGITPGEKMVAKALQKYGAYCVDTGANSAIFYAEKPTGPDATNNPFTSTFGPEWTVFTHIPWNKLRVLDSSVTYPGMTASQGGVKRS